VTPRLVVVGRVVLLIATALTVVAAFVATRGPDGRIALKPGGAYVCPMHPQVTADAPGDCPICHMALEPGSTLPRDPSGGTGQTPGVGEDAVEQTLALPPEAANLVRYSVGLVRGHVLPQELYAPASVESAGVIGALLYKDEVAALEPNERVLFLEATTAAEGIDATRIPETPVPWDRSTSRVRFRFDPKHVLQSGEPGWVKLAVKPRRMLVVPSTAVLESAGGPYVLTYTAATRTFAKRPVETGKVFSGFTAVVSGLKEREVIVAMNAFFLDAERRLHPAIDRAAEGPR